MERNIINIWAAVIRHKIQYKKLIPEKMQYIAQFLKNTLNIGNSKKKIIYQNQL